MGFLILGIMGVIYAAFTLSAVFFRGRVGFAIWVTSSFLTIAFLKIDLPPTDGEIISTSWFVTAAIVGFFTGMAVHILRAITHNIFLPLLLIVITPILLGENLKIVEIINALVSAY